MADLLVDMIEKMGLEAAIDPKGNVCVHVGPAGEPRVVVTAHMDELGLMVTGIFRDGSLQVTNLGGLLPWKWGETPVEILADQSLSGILSFGSVHTESVESNAVQGRAHPIEWNQVQVFTGRSPEQLDSLGVRPGTRVALSKSRRQLTKVGEYISGFFLDDRADLEAWLLVLEDLAKHPPAVPMLFAATVSEEIGGHGALYLLQKIRPEYCVALELGPITPDNPAVLSATPTVWAKDSYACTDVRDLEKFASLGKAVQFQVLSRGGSDASCAAANGLCARPITLGIPMENTHGCEIIHRDGSAQLAELTTAFLRTIESS
jgi:putative aminopeptidase FrvX